MNFISYEVQQAVSLILEAHAQTPGGKTLGDIIRVTWNTVIRPGIIFLFLVATVVFIWGLVKFVMSGGSELVSLGEGGEKRKQNKSNIQWGIFGMFIMVVTGAIMVILDNFFKSIH